MVKAGVQCLIGHKQAIFILKFKFNHIYARTTSPCEHFFHHFPLLITNLSMETIDDIFFQGCQSGLLPTLGSLMSLGARLTICLYIVIHIGGKLIRHSKQVQWYADGETFV